MRAFRLPLGQRVKGKVLYCSQRPFPLAGPDEPKAFLRVTWQWPKGGRDFWWH